MDLSSVTGYFYSTEEANNSVELKAKLIIFTLVPFWILCMASFRVEVKLVF